MYIKGKNRGGQTTLPPHPKKHHKPYRIRHVGLFLAGVLLVIFSAFEAGFLLGQSQPVIGDEVTSLNPPAAKSTLGEVVSGLGFSFRYDTAVFSAVGHTDSGQRITGKKLKQKLDLTRVELKPETLSASSQDALSRLTINMESSSAPFDAYKLKNDGDQNKALAAYFAPKADSDFTISQISSSAQVVGGLKLQKTVYQQTPRFLSGAKPVYSVMWTGIYHGRPLQVYLQNLLSGGQIPAIYGPVFDTLHFGPANGVLSASTASSRNFDINKVSPAVVKIYHFVCGTLVINDVKYGGDACDGGTGSGFLVSGDGYIATSGHVVVLDAADILVNQLLSDPTLLSQFTSAAGLSAQQSARSDVVASLLAKIYDLPSEKLRLENRREATFVSLGDQPLVANTQEQVKKILGTKDGVYIKTAKVVAVDYQPKDLLVIEQNTQTGFSASDVALLKVSAANSPYIRMADSSRLEQDASVSLIGFPADADNQLTKNSIITPSVTTGIISSIRQANGSSSLLFQTDADASAGNSGGPAIDGDGHAFGLVTYRFKSGEETNAAKSYIRDIADFSNLVDGQNISLNAKSGTQTKWEDALDLFHDQRYSKALVKFREVKELYPAQRLANSYINQAEREIRAGKDKKDPPYALIGIITIGLAGLLTTGVSVLLISRHRRAHLAYKAANPGGPTIVSPLN